MLYIVQTSGKTRLESAMKEGCCSLMITTFKFVYTRPPYGAKCLFYHNFLRKYYNMIFCSSWMVYNLVKFHVSA